MLSDVHGMLPVLEADHWPQYIVDGLRAAGVEYALTGDTAANLYSASAGEVWPVLYVADAAAASEAVGLTPRAEGIYGALITLIPFAGLCELERVEIDGLTSAALDQIVLDCYGGTGRMAKQADILRGRRQRPLLALGAIDLEPLRTPFWASRMSVPPTCDCADRRQSMCRHGPKFN